ncbi:MAG: TIGR03619 family F420-dependent LLM class oxidoreductase [Acidimicrobiia bacterium]
MEIGVLLPHFGEHATVEALIEGSQRIEEMGYDSLWVRDHILWTPHEMEGTDITFIEPLLTLAAISSVTTRVKLGSAVLIPIRWPLKVAQNLAALSVLSGGRVIGGYGLGNNPREFAAAGLNSDQREQIFVETIEILRAVWSGDNVSYKGEVFQFEDITLEPKPVAPIPLVYGGTTQASIRRALEYMDGWLPGRIPLLTLDARLKYLAERSAEAGKRISVGVIPVVKVDRDRSRARQNIDASALAQSSAGAKFWKRPPSGSFSTIEDLEGLVIAGTPEDCKRELAKFAERGIDYVVLDLRLDFSRYLEQLELLADAGLDDLKR